MHKAPACCSLSHSFLTGVAGSQAPVGTTEERYLFSDLQSRGSVLCLLAVQVLPGHAKLQIMHPVPRHPQAQEQRHHRHRGSWQDSGDASQAGQAGADAASLLGDAERGLGAAVDIGAGEAVFSVPLSTALVVLDEIDVEPSADAPTYLRLIAKLLGETAKVPDCPLALAETVPVKDATAVHVRGSS